MIDPLELDFYKSRSDHSAGFEYFYERLEQKAKELPIECPFLEIGTRAGGSALLIMEAIAHQERLFITVDPYGKNYKSDGDWPAIGERTYQETMRVLFEMAWKYHITHVHYRMTSADFMYLEPVTNTLWMNNRHIESPYSVVYLDGEHVDSVVARELDYFIPRMHTKGLIIIDDISYIRDTRMNMIKDIMKLGHEDNNRLFIEVNAL